MKTESKDSARASAREYQTVNTIRCTIMPRDERDFLVRTLAGLLRQGRPSSNPNCACRYRGSSGAACAVGLWIPDENYRAAIEGMTVGTVVRNLLPLELCSIVPEAVMRHVQRIHDVAALPKPINWAAALRDACARLNYGVVFEDAVAFAASDAPL